MSLLYTWKHEKSTLFYWMPSTLLIVTEDSQAKFPLGNLAQVGCLSTTHSLKPRSSSATASNTLSPVW